jgi:hypothetical protein
MMMKMSSSGRILYVVVLIKLIQLEFKGGVKKTNIMAREEVDILEIDRKIQSTFKVELSKLEEYRNKLKQMDVLIEEAVENDRLHTYLKEKRIVLNDVIENTKNNQDLNFYKAETASLLVKYRKILKTPIKISFTGKRTCNNKEKDRIINEYLKIAKKYMDVHIEEDNTNKLKRVTCGNCNSDKEFEVIDDNIYICRECFAQQVVLKYTSSYRDTDRVNISVKYVYDRKIHFRDCINQYQGKQNSTINQEVYNDLERQFELHYLLNTNAKGHERFKNITKEHINMFLKELGYTKHYENVNLIHYYLTGRKPDNINHLEYKLLNDFDTLTELYDKRFKNIGRKNFINTQYVLYQLLIRHKHPCKKEDFTILKTIDRKSFHDNICKTLFEELGWNYLPYF